VLPVENFPATQSDSETMRSWRKLHNEELHNSYSNDEVRECETCRASSIHEEEEKSIEGFSWKARNIEAIMMT
jgi:hypothetical protein